MGDLNPQPAD